MKFSLRTLVFTLPCLLVLGFAYAWVIEGYLDHLDSSRRNPWWGNNDEIDGLLVYLHDVQGTARAISAKDLNLWFANQLSDDSPVLAQLKEYDFKSTKIDVWDRAYVAVDLDKHKNPTLDPAKAVTVGIYSRGPDGRSKSHGCDPDDIASWRMSSKYDREDQESYWHHRKFNALRNLLIGIGVVFVLWIVGVVGYRMLFKKA